MKLGKYLSPRLWKCDCPRLSSHGVEALKCPVCLTERPCSSQKEAVERFPAYFATDDKRCVLCGRKSSDFRFGVCFGCVCD